MHNNCIELKILNRYWFFVEVYRKLSQLNLVYFVEFSIWFLRLYVTFWPQKLCGCKYQHQPLCDQRAVAVFSCLVCGCSLCHHKCCPHPQKPTEASLTDGKWHASVSTHVWLSRICSCHSWFVFLSLAVSVPDARWVQPRVGSYWPDIPYSCIDYFCVSLVSTHTEFISLTFHTW